MAISKPKTGETLDEFIERASERGALSVGEVLTVSGLGQARLVATEVGAKLVPSGAWEQAVCQMIILGGHPRPEALKSKADAEREFRAALGDTADPALCDFEGWWKRQEAKLLPIMEALLGEGVRIPRAILRVPEEAIYHREGRIYVKIGGLLPGEREIAVLPARAEGP